MRSHVFHISVLSVAEVEASLLIRKQTARLRLACWPAHLHQSPDSRPTGLATTVLICYDVLRSYLKKLEQLLGSESMRADKRSQDDHCR
jgi:hypothetical protein